MAIRVAINGYGRIGRNVLRAVYESERQEAMEIVAVNDLGDTATNAHLTRYDTVHGPFAGTVGHDDDGLVINGNRVRVFSERNPANLPWRDLGVDVVMECTGLFTSRDAAAAHLEAGAGAVLISAPGKGVGATVVYGVNHQVLEPGRHRIVSNASCTTNCLATLVKPLHEAIGLESGIMTTIHSFTNDQVLTDVYHSDLRRARAAAHNMIPTKTGAAAAVGLVLPELNGRLDGYAVRVPTINVSLVDLTFRASRGTTAEEVNEIVRAAAQGPLQGLLGYTEEPLVSGDFNHDSRSCIFDASLTKVIYEDMVKVTGWYDNEWGFSNRMVDTALVLAGAGKGGTS